MKIVKKLVVTLLIVSIFATMLPITASANGTIAWGAANVDGSSVRIRSGPGLTYSVLTQAEQGEVVVVLERTNSEWYKVNFHGTIGYMSVPLLENSRIAANFKARGSISGNVVNMRTKPNITSDILSSHLEGTEMTIIGINDGWYKVEHDGLTGYVRSDLMQLLPRSTAAPLATANTNAEVASPAPDPNLPLGQQITDYTTSYVGYKYVWGGASPSTGFDCSGLVTYVLGTFGISVTRNASGQYRDNGVHINSSDLVPGDLVFFSSNGRSVTHVGIYIGDGNYVHASTSRVGVIISDLSSRPLFGAKRVI